MVTCLADEFVYVLYKWTLKWSESCSVVSDSLRLHGLYIPILQAKILEWVAFPFSRGSSQPWDQTQVSRIAGGFFTSWVIREALQVDTNDGKTESFIIW